MKDTNIPDLYCIFLKKRKELLEQECENQDQAIEKLHSIYKNKWLY